MEKWDRLRGPIPCGESLTGGAWRFAPGHPRLLLLVRFADTVRLRRARWPTLWRNTPWKATDAALAQGADAAPLHLADLVVNTGSALIWFLSVKI